MRIFAVLAMILLGALAADARSYHLVSVEGRVMRVDGDHVMLLTRDGRMVPVDLRSVPDMARALLTFGREVEIAGFERPDGVVMAEMVEVDYGDPVGGANNAIQPPP